MTRLQYLLNHQLLMEKYLMVEVLEQVFFIKKLNFISLFDQIYLFSPSINVDHTWQPVKKYIEEKTVAMSFTGKVVDIKNGKYGNMETCDPL